MILLIIIISFSGHSSTIEISIGNPALCEIEAKKHNYHTKGGPSNSDNNGYTSYAKCIKQVR